MAPQSYLIKMHETGVKHPILIYEQNDITIIKNDHGGLQYRHMARPVINPCPNRFKRHTMQTFDNSFL